MRLVFFLSTVTFCFFTGMGAIALSRGRARSGGHRRLEAVFVVFCALLALWALGTALFVSARSEAEAYLLFNILGFSWFFAPGVFLLFALVLSGARLRLPFPALVFLPGAAVFIANLADGRAVVASFVKVAAGWHASYALSVWSFLNAANTIALPLAAAAVLARIAAFSADKRRRVQAGIVLAFLAPTFFLSVTTGFVLRFLGADELPPLAPSFFILLVIGLWIALTRYGLLELTPFTAAERILSSVTDAVVLVGKDGVVLDSNLNGSVRDGSLSSFVSGSGVDALLLERATEPGTAEAEADFAFAEGAFVPASVRIRTVLDGSGALIGYVLAAHDLTVEKSLARETALSSERAAALNRAEERFARLFRLSPSGMAVIDLTTGAFLDANDAACAAFGMNRRSLIGRDTAQAGLSVEPEALAPIRDALLAGKSVGAREIELSRASAGPLLLALAAVPIDFGDRAAALVSFIDISELMYLRRELFRAQKMESIGEMAAGLAHDFNNILTVIMGNISLARLGVEEQADSAAALESASAACARARDLSRQLLLYARGGVSELRLSDAAKLVQEAVRSALAGEPREVSFSVEPNLPRIAADGAQLAMAFGNLALNAARSMQAEGTMEVRVSSRTVEAGDPRQTAPGTYVCVEFIDNGEGISPENLHRVFDPYARSRKKTAGLGLALCDAIVKRHKGWMEVNSAPRSGSNFAAYLPAALAPEREGNKGAVLLAERDAAERLDAELRLKGLGFLPTVVADGEGALAAFKEARARGNPFRCVILDADERGRLGALDAASVIRSLDANVAIYVASDGHGAETGSDYTAYGVDGELRKPYSTDGLAARLAVIR